MRRIILLILTIFSVSAFAGIEDENITVQKIDKQYVINYYNYKTDVTDYFVKASLQGGGYTWEALVKAALTSESPELLSQIEFAAQGGAFIAYATSESAAEKVKSVIKKFSADLVYRGKLIKIATDGGYIE